MGVLGLLPALGLDLDDDGSERVALGRGRRDLGVGGGGARVGLFLAASLAVSMTDDWRETIEPSKDLGGAGAMSACPGTVGDSTLEATWSKELALETA